MGQTPGSGAELRARHDLWEPTEIVGLREIWCITLIGYVLKTDQGRGEQLRQNGG